VFEDDGLEGIHVGLQKPNMNAFAERLVQTILTECIDNFIVFGEDHLRYLVNELMNKHYNTHSSHQGLGNNPLPNPNGTVMKSAYGKVVYCYTTTACVLEARTRSAKSPSCSIKSW
jgi:putative transposase